MSPSPIGTQSKAVTLALGVLAILLVVFIIIYPDDAFQSSLGGLKLWWNYVFPALLPFLVVTQLMTGLGVVQAVGVLLDPFMRLFFRIPGIGGWALAAGLTAGYPAGAELTASLRKEGRLSVAEAERLLAISHLCSPVVLITVIGIGFLHSAKAGLVLAGIHYLSAILMGIWFRLTAPKEPAGEAAKARKPLRSSDRQGLLTRSLAALREARSRDGRAFGKMLGDAVSSANQTLMIVGGFMILFAVLTRMALLLLPAPLKGLSLFVPGLLEPHLGAYAITQSALPLPLLLGLLGAAAAWSGLSLHAQVRSFSLPAGIRYGSFLYARTVHAVLAFGLTLALWKPLAGWLADPKAAFLPFSGGEWSTASGEPVSGWALLLKGGGPLVWFTGLIALLGGASLVIFLTRGLARVFNARRI
ncbi:hypothetical protein MJA45_11930 [Paenibacillus aurantius]|uniref:Nucleoside transporter/FeoB GTPase Gate domain-containing protein n=1 Tax=Paenibacillus aurantius TaxID=2918900 RepID=A0AA96LGL3_9BACL|nr:nucleoside recognition domain-containing protein [Paenibacillus aurantius]WNQ13689.1 hypothetical protein MJA45_11930 [Paenibacillus aurantius]